MWKAFPDWLSSKGHEDLATVMGIEYGQEERNKENSESKKPIE